MRMHTSLVWKVGVVPLILVLTACTKMSPAADTQPAPGISGRYTSPMAPPDSGEPAAPGLDTLTLAQFAAHLSESFTLHHDEGTLNLTLAEARDLGWSRPGARNAFSLIFHGPAEPVLPQRMYRLAHAAFNLDGIFLVPVGPGGGGMRYEAVFT